MQTKSMLVDSYSINWSDFTIIRGMLLHFQLVKQLKKNQKNAFSVLDKSPDGRNKTLFCLQLYHFIENWAKVLNWNDSNTFHTCNSNDWNTFDTFVVVMFSTGVTCVRLIDHGVDGDWRTIAISASYDSHIRIWNIRHGQTSLS